MNSKSSTNYNVTIRQHPEDTSQAELHHRAAEQGQKRHGPDEAVAAGNHHTSTALMRLAAIGMREDLPDGAGKSRSSTRSGCLLPVRVAEQ